MVGEGQKSMSSTSLTLSLAFFFWNTPIKLWWIGACKRKKDFFFSFILSQVKFWHFSLCVSNTLSEYTYFYMSKKFTSYTFLLLFKIIESLQCILNGKKNPLTTCILILFRGVILNSKWQLKQIKNNLEVPHCKT